MNVSHHTILFGFVFFKSTHLCRVLPTPTKILFVGSLKFHLLLPFQTIWLHTYTLCFVHKVWLLIGIRVVRVGDALQVSQNGANRGTIILFCFVCGCVVVARVMNIG
jgi:hypothetical protein